MKVLQKGNRRNIWIGQCQTCGSIIEATSQDDLELIELPGDYSGNCPECDSFCLFKNIDDSYAKNILRKNKLKHIYEDSDDSR